MTRSAWLVLIGLSTFFVPRAEAADVIYAATSNGVFRSTDGGSSWTPANTGLSGINVFSLAIDPRTPATVDAGTFGNRVFKTTDAGTTWASSNVGLTDDLQVVALAIDPTNTRVLYAGTRFNGIFKSADAGARWSSVNPAPTGTLFAIVHFSLVTDPVNAGTVYAGTFDGVFKSTDGGTNWTASNDGLPPSSRVFALALHPQRLSR